MDRGSVVLMADTATRTATATVGGQSFSFTYRPEMVTRATLAPFERSRAAKSSHAAVAAARDVVLATVVSWDITDAGESVPITRERLDQMPASVVLAVIPALLDDDVKQRRLDS